MIWKVVLSNLVEAHWDLRKLQAWLYWIDNGKPMKGWKRLTEWNVRKGYLSPGCLAVKIEHIYHHVNWAWNCRNADEARAVRCDMEDYCRWEKFPKDWPELWLPPSSCRKPVPKWRFPDYRWHLVNGCMTMMRIAIDEAEYTLGSLIDCIMMRLGNDLPNGWKRAKPYPKNAVPITESDFADMMRHLYICLNEAWHRRKLKLSSAKRSIPCSRKHLRESSCFPREFKKFWPRNGLPPKCKKRNGN
jgi:hypothetical protein